MPGGATLDACSIRLKTADLVAQSTALLLQRVATGAGGLAGVERRVVWLIAWSGRAVPTAAREALSRPGVLYNPNKESLAVTHSPEAELCVPGPGEAIVATWPRDREAEVTVRAILSGAGCEKSLGAACCVTLWWLRAASSADAKASLDTLAREVSVVRDRSHGVLANPHLAEAAVFTGPVTLGGLAARVGGALAVTQEGVTR